MGPGQLADGAVCAGSWAIVRFALTGMLSVWPAAPAFAQAAPVQAGVVLRDESRVTKVNDLDFGKVIPGDSGGTMTIAPDGGVTTGGTVLALGGAHPASFNLARRVLADYPTYLAPTTSTTIQLVNQANPAQKMTLTNFTTDFNRRGLFGLPAYFFVTSYDFHVGGRLSIAANQPSGTYVGTFTVSIQYQ